jgi:REP element-mobilizing transposase RayT
MYSGGMSQSLARIILHLVFSTKHRERFLQLPDLRAETYAYMAGTLQRLDCEPILINGTDDHVHILMNFSRTITIANLVGKLKNASSRWLREQKKGMQEFRWQAGYGIFSVSQSKLEEARQYVAAQEQHHRTVSFQDEFRALCKKHRIPIDERYVWD